MAQDLIAFTQALCLDGELARAEPKRLRYRLLHTARRLAFHARRAVLHLPRRWPWAPELAAAFHRLRLLAAPLPARRAPPRTPLAARPPAVSGWS